MTAVPDTVPSRYRAMFFGQALYHSVSDETVIGVLHRLTGSAPVLCGNVRIYLVFLSWQSY